MAVGRRAEEEESGDFFVLLDKKVEDGMFFVFPTRKISFFNDKGCNYGNAYKMLHEALPWLQKLRNQVPANPAPKAKAAAASKAAAANTSNKEFPPPSSTFSIERTNNFMFFVFRPLQPTLAGSPKNGSSDLSSCSKIGLKIEIGWRNKIACSSHPHLR